MYNISQEECTLPRILYRNGGKARCKPYIRPKECLSGSLIRSGVLIWSSQPSDRALIHMYRGMNGGKMQALSSECRQFIVFSLRFSHQEFSSGVLSQCRSQEENRSGTLIKEFSSGAGWSSHLTNLTQNWQRNFRVIQSSQCENWLRLQT
eukprot:scaffold13838_cov104-Skeletonema_dohrnii-CCMP3373.AAC.4